MNIFPVFSLPQDFSRGCFDMTLAIHIIPPRDSAKRQQQLSVNAELLAGTDLQSYLSVHSTVGTKHRRASVHAVALCKSAACRNTIV